MSKIPKAAPREQPAEGTYPFVCVQVIDLGTQPSKVEKYGDTHWVQLALELVEERTSDNQPMVVYTRVNNINTPRSKLTKTLKAWLNVKDLDNFDMERCLGAAGMVTIVHNEHEGNTYANVQTMTALPKGMKVKKHSEPLISLFLDESFDEDVLGELPEFLQTMIKASPEYKALQEAPKTKAKTKVATKKKK